MNKRILDQPVQEYINNHLNDDVHKIAMAKSPFGDVEAKELASQIAAKNKSQRKLPSWYAANNIYYPALLSIEQCSSETTACYKAELVKGNSLIDLTGGFGVDSLYFAKKTATVTHCEINAELSEIAAHNAQVLGQDNISFFTGDGLAWLQETNATFDTIYIDPARRSTAGKVFMLKDCTPNVIEDLDLLLAKSKRIIIKTAPLLDLSAGLKELKNVAEIHIVSTKNEVKELLWVLEKDTVAPVKIKCVTLNEEDKHFTFLKGEEEQTESPILTGPLETYLYEPDAALLKSGAFNLIAKTYGLKKLDTQTQLYTAAVYNNLFPGRIFKINRVITSGELKKEKQLNGNVIVRNYRDKAENLVKKYKIKPDQHQFLLFTQSRTDGYIVIDARIIQHY
ncbi:methyltransferase domain-containing protein [Pedobacter nyackensis]|uniref:methyltransferase domain-containing protein n=1 Tax=Pedobacter nyackensis TaxID=475255 RepID=UPI00292F7904|nr:methyltransferase domain-containing protein [Pedobacter nyackensis]